MNRVDDKKALILIADDQEFMRSIIRNALNTDEYDVIEAENGEEAVKLFAEYKPDIVLMDAIMPLMDGFEAVKRIRESEVSETTPILMITALGDSHSINEGFKAGVNDFIQKPINVDILNRRISVLVKELNNKEKLRQSEERFRLLAENARDCILILQFKPFYKYIYISPVIKDIIGYDAKDFYENPFLFKKIVLDADRHLFAARNLKTASFEMAVEVRCLHKNGTVVFLEIQYVPLFGKDHQITGLQIISRDITQRKKDEVRKRIELTQKVLYETVTALSATIETRDPYTFGHQERVARLAVAIAQQLGLAIDQIEGIKAAALLHDIGKIHVPAEFLSKPGKLSEPEFAFIKTHAKIGYEILKSIRFPWPVAQIVCQHHERMDGSGYPYGLSGDQIPIETRIISVADVVEAMASHRPYRVALGIEQALEEILHNAGRFYDPQVVYTCIDLFTKKDYKLYT